VCIYVYTKSGANSLPLLLTHARSTRLRSVASKPPPFFLSRVRTRVEIAALAAKALPCHAAAVRGHVPQAAGTHPWHGHRTHPSRLFLLCSPPAQHGAAARAITRSHTNHRGRRTPGRCNTCPFLRQACQQAKPRRWPFSLSPCWACAITNGAQLGLPSSFPTPSFFLGWPANARPSLP
jgi:hypothetical protein